MTDPLPPPEPETDEERAALEGQRRALGRAVKSVADVDVERLLPDVPDEPWR